MDMTATEYMAERRRIIDTRNKLNDARRDLDLARKLSVFPAKENTLVNVVPTVKIPGWWDTELKPNHKYTVSITNIRLGSQGKTVLVDFRYTAPTKGAFPMTWYGVNATKLKIVK